MFRKQICTPLTQIAIGIVFSQASMLLSALMVAQTHAKRNLRTTLKIGEVCVPGGMSMVIEDNSKLCEQV